MPGPDLVEAALAVAAVERIRQLHKPMPHPWRPEDGQVCEHCYSLCHSETGLGCEQPVDAAYPCETVRLLPARPGGDGGFTCPRCLRTSWNPNDKREGYCGACHDWTGAPA